MRTCEIPSTGHPFAFRELDKSVRAEQIRWVRRYRDGEHCSSNGIVAAVSRGSVARRLFVPHKSWSAQLVGFAVAHVMRRARRSFCLVSFHLPCSCPALACRQRYAFASRALLVRLPYFGLAVARYCGYAHPAAFASLRLGASRVSFLARVCRGSSAA